ncbi:MAG: amidohydrolase [Sediminibacterium sp. Gen4]|jgi:amidohydrolase|uniref:M20 metallopeptidase family protein n=1 Tax=unclassified Sediminibacterium TaxID=2635961 RepID=UPI0015BDD67F|nr:MULTISPECIES: M20 family metallopeptidase [unclassified Sediminibacterium]MBW0161604.1 amidohydrolase [Sediminibacterium sp.]MBW0165415.1 amidohydrolase [Sediminibacterium sp.]NWK65358.1 amidohydrolase [Sediminibacterium sp. Gen4]
MLLQQIKDLASKYAADTVAIRSHLHANPELSYQEFETSKFVQSKLQEIGIEFEVIATTGVQAIIRGKNPESRVIALRADMDALPIQEENDVRYRSQKPGVMHACGHDVHTSILLGAAKILYELRESWEGTVKLLFQPGEEKNPGGASYMIRDGALQNPTPQGIIGLHVHPGLETGKLSFRKGRVMASADEIYITIKGKGGHAASPNLTADTVLIASHLIVSLQQIISRNKNPLSPSVLSICSIQGGHTTNVIPSEVKLMGTFRAMDEEWRFRAHDLIRKNAIGLVESMGGEIDLHIDIGYPTVDNDPVFTETAWKQADAFMGKENVLETEMRMGAEDFGYYTQVIPGCFFRLGVRNEAKGIVHNVHTPLFDIDERAIEIGMGNMAWLGATVG